MEQATKEKLKKQLPAFIAGLVVGVAGALGVPELMIDHFEGTVSDKKRLRDRLMVMINMPKHGEVIATFTEKVAEIDLLVEEGDEVTLGLGAYEPFVDNPPIRAVRKVDPAGGTALPGPEELAGEAPDPAPPAVDEPVDEVPEAELGEWTGDGEEPPGE